MEMDLWFQKDHSEAEVFQRAKMHERRGERYAAKLLLQSYYQMKLKPHRAEFIGELLDTGASIEQLQRRLEPMARRVAKERERKAMGPPQRVAQEPAAYEWGAPQRVAVNPPVLHQVPPPE